MVLAFVLLGLLAISLLYNLASFVSSFAGGPATYGHTSGPRLEEVVLEHTGAHAKVAVVEVAGIITGDAYDGGAFSMVDVIKAQLRRAEKDSRVKAVVLKVDSPGGEVLASDEIYRAIANFQETSGKPVIAAMGNVAASGGYYVSAPCRWIVANELTLTGSIGVIMNSLNYRGLMNKVGVQPQVYKSGRFKDMLSGMREPTDVPAEEKEMLQDLVQEVFGKFKGIVAEGRANARQMNSRNKTQGQALAPDWADYADGRVLSGTEAFKLGFVDELGNFEDAVDRAKALAGIKDANLVQYLQHFDISDLFRMFGRAESRTVKLDLGVDAPKLRAGQLYFLAPTYLQ